MFESVVSDLLKTYLGDYVEGLDKDALSISVWKGDVVLNNLKLRTDALKSLNLPVRVSAGFLGSLRLKVPWRALGKEPVIVELDRIFLLAVPETFDNDEEEEEADDVHKAATRAKHRAIARGEKEWLDAMSSRSKQQHGEDADASPGGGEKQSYVKAYIETILGNLQVSISNIHIRYEDFSTSSHPFRAGITLDQITAFTVDEAGEKTFVSSNALERLLKSAQLRRLAVYFDTDVSGDKEAELIRDVPTEDWDKFFMPGIHDDASVEGKRQFVLAPIDCKLTYKRLGAREMRRKGDSKAEPKQSFRFKMDTLQAQVSEPQVRDLRTLLDFVAAAKVRSRHADLRPHRSAKRSPRAWWRYAIMVVTRQYCIRRLSWTEVSRIAGIRRAYTASFYSLLKHRAVSSTSQKDKEIIGEYEEDIKKLEAELPVDTAVWFRVLVHMQMIREKKAEERKVAKAKAATTSRSDSGWTSWFSYVKSQPAEPKKEVETTETPRGDVLSTEEQAELDRLMGVDDVAKAQRDDGDDDPYDVRIAIDAVVNSLALKLVDGDGEVVAHSYMKLARSCVSLFSETMDLSLCTSEYGMSMDSGLQVQAGVNNDSAAEDTLDIKFTLKPQDKAVDSSLAVVMAPIYVTFEKAALDRLQTFLMSGASDDANRNLAALEAAAVQQLGDVAGQAQEQVKSALSNDSRFELNLDIAAPKIALPIRGTDDAIVEHLLLDLGQFKCITTDLPTTSSAEERAVYERIGLFGKNTCVFHAGPDFVWGSVGSGTQRGVGSYIVEELNFSVIFDAGTIQRGSSPDLPHSRVFVDIPSIKLHFSPARYRPIESLLSSFSASVVEDEDLEGARRTYLPWASADYETACSILQKDGLGLGGAYQWLEKWAVLKADKLYILDTPTSTTSFATYLVGIGRKAMPMPTDMIGVDFAIAIADSDARGFNAVLSNKSSLIMRLDSRATATLWLSSVRAAITRFTDSFRANDDALKALDAAGDLSRSESMTSSSFMSSASTRDNIYVECTLSTVDASIYAPLVDDCVAIVDAGEATQFASVTGGRRRRRRITCIGENR